jgi:FAD/FMN-containing dehydrogenase
MNVTNFLLGIILLILARQFYPGFLNTILLVTIGGFFLYSCYWLVAKFPEQRKKRKAEKQREEKDEAEFWEYEGKHRAIRAKYDPENVWNEATSVPQEYLDEISALNLAHRDMLQRRNGWTTSDFYS